MQLITSDRQGISTSNPINEQWEQILALEKAQDEIVLLREQISSLQQYLSEQLGQPQALEQELYYANQEIELLNAENQRLYEAKQLYLEEIKEFAKSLSGNEKTNRKALLRWLSKFCDEIAPPEELEPLRAHF